MATGFESCRRYPSYYKVLGVCVDSSENDIRRAYRKLAMRWHPDKWSRNPSVLGEVKQKFQEIQEAYSVLSDKTKRLMYDAGLYDCSEEEEGDEGLSDFLQELMSHVADERRKEKIYSIGELQSLFADMVGEFGIPVDCGSSHPPAAVDDCRSRKRVRYQQNENLHRRASKMGFWGAGKGI